MRGIDKRKCSLAFLCLFHQGLKDLMEERILFYTVGFGGQRSGFSPFEALFQETTNGPYRKLDAEHLLNNCRCLLPGTDMVLLQLLEDLVFETLCLASRLLRLLDRQKRTHISRTLTGLHLFSQATDRSVCQPDQLHDPFIRNTKRQQQHSWQPLCQSYRYKQLKKLYNSSYDN